MTEREFINGADATETDVADYEAGRLVEWRRGLDGIMWYRRVPGAAETPNMIYGVAGDIDGADDDDLDEPALDDFERMQLQEWADRLRRGSEGDADD